MRESVKKNTNNFNNKCAHVVVFQKAFASVRLPQNYRPISFLPTISKVGAMFFLTKLQEEVWKLNLI